MGGDRVEVVEAEEGEEEEEEKGMKENGGICHLVVWKGDDFAFSLSVYLLQTGRRRAKRECICMCTYARSMYANPST